MVGGSQSLELNLNDRLKKAKTVIWMKEGNVLQLFNLANADFASDFYLDYVSARIIVIDFLFKLLKLGMVEKCE